MTRRGSLLSRAREADRLLFRLSSFSSLSEIGHNALKMDALLTLTDQKKDSTGELESEATQEEKPYISYKDFDVKRMSFSTETYSWEYQYLVDGQVKKSELRIELPSFSVQK